MLFSIMIEVIAAASCVTAAPLSIAGGGMTIPPQDINQWCEWQKLKPKYPHFHLENDDRLEVHAIHKDLKWDPAVSTSSYTNPGKSPSYNRFRPNRFYPIAKLNVSDSEAAARKIVPRYSIDPSLCTWSRDASNFGDIPSSCGVSWLESINKWRTAYNKRPLVWSAHNARVSAMAGRNNLGGAQNGLFQHTDLRAAGTQGETATAGYIVPPNGRNMYGITPFESALLAWLCEVPGPQLYSGGVDVCKHLVADTNLINVAGQRGHYDAFLSDYKSIGCWFTYNSKKPEGLFAGIYVCNYSL